MIDRQDLPEQDKNQALFELANDRDFFDKAYFLREEIDFGENNENEAPVAIDIADVLFREIIARDAPLATIKGLIDIAADYGVNVAHSFMIDFVYGKENVQWAVSGDVFDLLLKSLEKDMEIAPREVRSHLNDLRARLVEQGKTSFVSKVDVTLQHLFGQNDDFQSPSGMD